MSEKETIQELSKINRMFASECDYLKNKLRKKENIIKKIREELETWTPKNKILQLEKKELLEILDKEKE